LESAYNKVSKRLRQGKAAEVAEPREIEDALYRDPDSYQAAKKELKRATLEFHRFLELLKDYQVLTRRPHSHNVLISFQALNITAIHKSVKKFEKTTRVNSLIQSVHNRLLIHAVQCT